MEDMANEIMLFQKLVSFHLNIKFTSRRRWISIDLFLVLILILKMQNVKCAEMNGDRAKDDKGHFVADDPTTPDVNEAYVGGKKPTKKKTKKKVAKKNCS